MVADKSLSFQANRAPHIFDQIPLIKTFNANTSTSNLRTSYNKFSRVSLLGRHISEQVALNEPYERQKEEETLIRGGYMSPLCVL